MKLFKTLKKSLWEVLEEQEPFGIVNNQNIDYYLEKATMKAEKEIKEQSNTETKQLKAENESLKKQLENAVVLPCKIGTICLHIWCKEILPFKLFGVVLKNTSIGFAKELCLFGQMFYNHKWIDYDISINEFNSKLGETWFLTKPEAEARLKELEAQND